MGSVLFAALFLLGLGLAAALVLVVAAKVFYIDEDPRIIEVEDALLGANCGACGYAGCAAAAEAVVKGKAKPNVCIAGGNEIALAVAEIMGVEVELAEPRKAVLGCRYSADTAALRYIYNGAEDCRAAALLYGGAKECWIGCLGLGTCVKACPFDALSMGENGLPVVDEKKCKACGVCAEVCPKGIIKISSVSRRIVADNKTTECTPPCRRHCPAEIDISRYIRHIVRKEYAEALDVIREKNPFPLVCGWICPAPCEFHCRRNYVDLPVGINSLKKFVANWEKDEDVHDLPYLPPETDKRISIIGGGVEGLTAAYFLRRLGYSPTVLEATDKLGGILRYVIPEERLPRDALDWDIRRILDTGVAAETGRRMGKDFTLASLLDGVADRALLTTGGWDSRKIMSGGTDAGPLLPGTWLLLDFLLAEKHGAQVEIGKHIVIVGGGGSAQKAADACIRKGAEHVTVLYHFDEAEVRRRRLDLCDTEGIETIFSATPSELRGEGESLRTLVVRTADGDPREIELDTVIIGAGRLPEMLFIGEGGGRWRTAEISRALIEETDLGVFSVCGSEQISDHSDVVMAVRRGRKIARAVHLDAEGEPIGPEADVITDEEALQNIREIENAEEFKAVKRNIRPTDTLDESAAADEARRCLNCGLICYENCLAAQADALGEAQ